MPIALSTVTSEEYGETIVVRARTAIAEAARRLVIFRIAKGHPIRRFPRRHVDENGRRARQRVRGDRHRLVRRNHVSARARRPRPVPAAWRTADRWARPARVASVPADPHGT